MNQTMDSKAFEILVRQHHRRILAYALALVHAEDVAEDLVQDAFLAAYCGLPSFDTQQDFGNWMRGIVKNKFREWARQRQEFSIADATLAQLEARHAKWDETDLTTRGAILSALRKCRAGLGEDHQRLISRFYDQNQTSAGIAQTLGATDTAVRKRLERIRKLLLHCIDRRLGAI